ncbi:dihydroneopterin aldolase [Stappia stellulata]|uniref:dihydroneopterin aldolase n=1 Tax=Stappia stellulata TaxID=71235 RepID=UPI001CD45C34|nr:dihydroneopterin aldolase [Stappia stellulata]MCA1244515.1 dihydroneopterin aldolase [Stappia stellulata]
MDAIHLQDLAFYAYHGVHAEEARLGQRFQVDLTCHVDLSEASASDRYEDTVCYGLLTETVERVVTTSRFQLIERLAGAIADAVLDCDARIESVRVRVHKPGAPLPIASGRVSVEISRARAHV